MIDMRIRRPTPAVVRALALASLVANVGIVVTGGAVRLTGSGLGCPTWPRCTDESYVPTGALSGHELVEFGNRTLTFLLGVIALATLVAAWTQRPRRPAVPRLAVAVFLSIPAQAVVGGITVLTGLNPWVVATHFLISIAVIAAALVLWRRTRTPADAPAERVVRREVELLGRITVVVAALTLALGTVVTGSGPHAGDEAAARTGFDPETVSQLHADSVMLLVGLTVGCWLALRATGAPAAARRAAVVLFGVELAQGLVGFVQYFTGLPEVLVGLHMLGACLVWIAVLRMLLAMRVPSAGEPQDEDAPAQVATAVLQVAPARVGDPAA